MNPTKRRGSGPAGPAPDEMTIDFRKVSEMLFHEEKYIREFARASILTFRDFAGQFRRALLEKDLENLRRAGHKVRPVAQLLGLENLIEEYERSKSDLENAGIIGSPPREEDLTTESSLTRSAERVDEICKRVILDFETIINRLETDRQ